MEKGMALGGGGRMPSWKERENNKKRERRRRAIAAKIYAGLRAHGNYVLPKHCDNNEVLRALCAEAGWAVEPDGTTYRKGCKPVEPMELVGGSASASQCSSYQLSPRASYNLSPFASSFPSPASSSYLTNANLSNNLINGVPDANSLIPWLKNLSSNSSSSASSSKRRHLYIHTGSVSAPVTPPLSSPTARSPRIRFDWDDPNNRPSWPPGAQYTFLPSSTPASPGRQIIPNSVPTSPTFSLMSRNPFGFASEASSRMWTPGQSGMSSPVMCGAPDRGDVAMMDCGASAEFAFGSSVHDNLPAGGLVKAWEGERIHEECVSDELELTLGSSRTRADA